MERYRLHFIAAMAAAGLLTVLLSLAPWVEFGSIDAEGVTPDAPKASVTINGTSISRWRDEENLLRNDVENVDGWCSCRAAVGDGFLTLALGVIMVGAAGIAFLRGGDRPMAMVGVAASLGTFVVAGYNGLAEWNAYVWTPLQNLEAMKGTVQPALYLLTGASLVAAIAAGLLWGVGAEEAHEELLEQEEDIGEEESYSFDQRDLSRRTNPWV